MKWLKLSIVSLVCISLLNGCQNAHPKDDLEAAFADDQDMIAVKMFRSYHHLKTQFPNIAKYDVLPYYEKVNKFKNEHSKCEEYFIVDRQGLSFAHLTLDNYPEDKISLDAYYAPNDFIEEGFTEADRKDYIWTLVGQTNMLNTEITKAKFVDLAKYFEVDEDILYQQCSEMFIQSKEKIELGEMRILMSTYNEFVVYMIEKRIDSNEVR